VSVGRQLARQSFDPVSGIVTRERREPRDESGLRLAACEPDERSTILVVDDDDRVRRLLRAELEPVHQVIECADGDEALSLLEREPIDLVLLDARMPGRSGFDTCREIKAATAGGIYLPVILLTSLYDDETGNDELDSDADDYLLKPIDRVDLQLRVKAFLRLRAQERAVRSQLEALRDLEELKDDLATLIVHDLRNPLSGIVPILTAAVDAVDSPSIAEDLRIAVDAAEKMRRALEDLLRVRELEEGRLLPKRERVSLDELCRDALRTIHGAARLRNVRLEYQVEGAMTAKIDGGLVRRAVENLVMNAVKFTPRGTTVTVMMWHAGGRLDIAVSDCGRGVPESLKEAVFAKFARLDSQQAGSRRGFGLGLYLVRLVATAHGGSVSVENRPSGGATFRMQLSTSVPTGSAR